MTGRGNQIKRTGTGAILLVALVGACAGCGATKSRTATEQLIMSDALDRAVSQIDFQELAGQSVFFDTKYLVNTKDPAFIGNQKGLGFVNVEYVTSSLRQQMIASGLKLQDKMEDADYVVEARLGAIGFDNNEVLYGIPASNPIAVASAFMPTVPAVPAIPELAIAKKVLNVGAAKVGVFAYDRKTREAVWQAGISQAASDARDTWVLGVGPFQQGSIYKGGTAFAGSRLQVPHLAPTPAVDEEVASDEAMSHADVHLAEEDPLDRFSESRSFRRLHDHPEDDATVRRAVFVEPIGAAAAPDSPKPTPAPTAATTPEAKASETKSPESKTPAPAPAPAGASPLPKPG